MGKQLAIKPIDTEFNGNLFRSRLEARWAVFFNAMGIRYEYEAQGVEIDGVRYLPDFWLPGSGYFVEIKHEDDFDFDKPSDLAAAGAKVMVIQGYPDKTFAKFIIWIAMYGRLVPLHFSSLVSCGKCDALLIVFSPKRDGEVSGSFQINPCTCEARNKNLWHPAYALQLAAHARFEHGQTPTPRR